MNDTKFRPSERLSGRSELERVRKKGQRRTLPELVLFLPGQPERKLACAAKRKVGTAVVRNLHRRKLKEFYRLNKHLWPEGTHFYALFRQPVSDWEGFESKLSVRLATL